MTIEAALPAAVRRSRIATLVAEQGFVRVSDLRDRFGISEVTLRSDLDALAGASLLQRIHGGAIARAEAEHPPSATSELPFERASLSDTDQKRSIGVAAAALVESGQAVILDVGTTTAAVAAALIARTDLRDVVVITNAINIAVTLESAIPRFTVIVTGGTLRPLQHSLVDPLAGEVLDHIHADIAFIGCSGVHATAGITNVNLPEADVKRRMLAAAARVVVVADSSKLGVAHHSRVAALSDVDTLITDAGADARNVESLGDAGLLVAIASS